MVVYYLGVVSGEASPRSTANIIGDKKGSSESGGTSGIENSITIHEVEGLNATVSHCFPVKIKISL